MLNRMERTLLTLLCVVLLCASCCALAEDVTETDITYAFVEESKEIGEVDLAEVMKEDREQTKPYTTQETGEEFESNASVVEINDKNFPDWTFRNFVQTYIDNGDGKLTQEEINKVIEIYLYTDDVKTLKGVEYFTKLETLYCVGNKLTALDVSKNKELKVLRCGENNLTKLNLKNNTKLERLRCGYNKITQLDISNCRELKELICIDNSLSKININKNTKIEYLDCSENKLKSLDVSKCDSLAILICNNNKLTNLKMGKHPKLETIKCYNNQIKTLDVKAYNTLAELECQNNKLSNLTLGNHKKLQILHAEKNNIKTIDIANCPILKKRLKGKNTVEEGYYHWNDESLSFDMDTVLISNNTQLFPPKGCVSITATYFPDSKFREYLLYFIDNGDGYLTSKECKSVKKIEVNYCDLTNLKGIEYFTGLETLRCKENKLSNLDIRKNKNLACLQCEYNKINAIDIGNCPKLKALVKEECSVDDYLIWGKEKLSIDIGVTLTDGGKKLYPDEQSIIIDKTNFPDSDFIEYIEEYIDNGDRYLSPNERDSIKKIDVDDWTISDLSGIKYFINLEILDCAENLLTALDMSRNSALRELDCSCNQISLLDVSKCTALKKLVCYDNPIQSFDVSTLSANLYSLALSGNWETDDESISCTDGVNLLCFPLDTVLYDGGRIIYQMVEETDE